MSLFKCKQIYQMDQINAKVAKKIRTSIPLKYDSVAFQ